MSVEFTDEKSNSTDDDITNKSPTMVRWVLKTGIVKDEKQANIVLLGIAVVFFVITLFVIFSGPGKPKQKITYLEDIPASVRATIPPSVLKTIPSRNN